MSKTGKTVALYTLLHFLVDLTTIFLISSILLGRNLKIADRGNIIILYNLVAFAGQLPIGILADIINKNRIFAATGCILAGLAYLFLPGSPWIACVLAASGNGAFHIGAGCEILKISMPKAKSAGIFVSSGALGVWLAYRIYQSVFLWIFPSVMLISFSVLLLWRNNALCVKNKKIEFKKPTGTVFVAVSFFMITIIMRSLVGMIMNFSWKAVPVFSFLSVVTVMAGKALGGAFSDKYGCMKTAVISLGISFVCFAAGFDFWFFGIIGTLCFNMTMPLTLTAIAELSDGKYGFSFGLTTFALALGFIPTVFGADKWFGKPLMLFCVAASLVLMLAGYRKTARGIE